MSADAGVLEAPAVALYWDSPVGVLYSVGCGAVAVALEDCYCCCLEE